MSGQGPESCQERYHDELAAYALGALSPEEAAALERHLEGCDACEERLRWLQPAVDLLPATVPQYEPPPGLREELMATVREEAAAEPSAARERPPAPDRPPGRLGRLLDRLAPMRPALAGLAVLAVLAAGVAGWALRGGDDEQVRSFAVEPVGSKLAATGTLEVRDGSGTLSVENLPPLPEDEVYQAWTVRSSQAPQPSSIFVAESSGHASATIPEIPAGTDRVLVTEEPSGGSPVPTSAAVLGAEIG